MKDKYKLPSLRSCNTWIIIYTFDEKLRMISIIKGLFTNTSFDILEDEVRELFKSNRKAELIDVRTMPEYKMDHINPCRNIDIREKSFDEKVKYLDKQGVYVLYCRTGKRSVKAAKRLQNMGFANVFSLKGGIESWEGVKRVK